MKIWIYIGGVQNGPYDLREFPGLPVKGSTPVWHEGMADWKPAAKAPATAKYFPDGVKTPAPVVPESELYGQAGNVVEKESRMGEDNARVSDEPLMSVENEMAEALEESTSQHADAETGVLPQSESSEEDAVTPLEGIMGEEVETACRVASSCDEISEEERLVREKLEAKARARRYPAYLPWSIVLTCLCCTPTSIAAIVTGALTLAARRKHNWKRARKLSRATEWLVIISITLGIMSLPFSILFQGL